MNLEEFKSLHEEKLKSNLSIKEFMVSKGLPVHQYYYWARKMNGGNQEESGGSFIQIVPNHTISPVSVEYPNGVKINFSELPTVRLLVDLVNQRK